MKTITKSPNRQYIFVTEDGKTAECFEDLGKSCLKKLHRQINFQSSFSRNIFQIAELHPKKEESQYTKPKMSYAQLIAEALLTGQDRMLTLNEIYIAINKQHPYYSLDAATGRNWQNAIRSVIFTKVQMHFCTLPTLWFKLLKMYKP